MTAESNPPQTDIDHYDSKFDKGIDAGLSPELIRARVGEPPYRTASLGELTAARLVSMDRDPDLSRQEDYDEITRLIEEHGQTCGLARYFGRHETENRRLVSQSRSAVPYLSWAEYQEMREHIDSPKQ